MPEDYQNSEQDNQDFEQESDLIQRPPLDRNRKIAAGVLAVLAVFVIGMWAVQLKESINQPFAYKGGSESANQSGTCTGADCQAESDEALKTKDTDADGLTDYEELYLYKTSPYLEDSDSDGFSDKQEIDNSKDPNCPIGRDCYSVGIVEGDKSVVSEGEADSNPIDSSSLNSLLDQMNYEEIDSVGAIVDSGSEADLEALLGGSMDASTLRQLLIQAGAPEEVLNQLSDEDLMKSYEEILSE